MREPSIHISRTAIKKFLEQHSQITSKNINEFMAFGRRYSLDHRSLVNTNKKTQEKAQRRVRGSIGDAQLVADLIYSTRIRMKHIGVTKIKQSDPQWTQVKELTIIINEFCNQNQLSKRKGYIEFINLGLKLFQSTRRPNYAFVLKWLSEKASWISDEYNSIESMKQDDTPEDTRLVHDIYNQKVIEMTGIQNNYTRDPTQYKHFVEAKRYIDKLDVDYEVFLDAQFDALAFFNGIPKISDLYGDKAKERLIRYMSSNNLYLENPANSKRKDKVDWSQFKK